MMLGFELFMVFDGLRVLGVAPLLRVFRTGRLG